MSRVEFMKELEGLLSDIPIEERTEALQYYDNYFDDAGESREEEVVLELGSPARVAGIIKADLDEEGMNQDTRGYFTEKGYEETIYRDDRYEIVRASDQASEDKKNSYEENGSREGASWKAGDNQGMRGVKLLLIILLACFALPVVLPILLSGVGVAFGLFMALVGITFGFGLAGLVMVATGIGVFFLGFIQFGISFATLIVCGAGLFVFGLGVLFTLVSTWVGKRLIPSLIRGIVYLCRLPFQKRSVTA